MTQPAKTLRTILELYHCDIVNKETNKVLPAGEFSSIAGCILGFYAAEHGINSSRKDNEDESAVEIEVDLSELDLESDGQFSKLQANWIENVLNHTDEIDPEKEYDWYELSFGFAIGSGLPIKKARMFAEALRKKELL